MEKLPRPSVTWWRHQMEPFSALLAIERGNHRSPVNSPHKGQRRGTLMFSLICVWINGWVNNRKAGGLRRYRAHYDFIVMHRWIDKGSKVDLVLILKLNGVYVTSLYWLSFSYQFQKLWNTCQIFYNLRKPCIFKGFVGAIIVTNNNHQNPYIPLYNRCLW